MLLVLHSRWFDAATDPTPYKRKHGKRVKPSVRGAGVDSSGGAAADSDSVARADCGTAAGSGAVSGGGGAAPGDGLDGAVTVGGAGDSVGGSGSGGDSDCDSDGDGDGEPGPKRARAEPNPFCHAWQSAGIVYPVPKGA